MNIKKKIIGAAIAINSLAPTTANTKPNTSHSTPHTDKKEITTPEPTKASKRTPQKVYYKFAEIPAISDSEAALYKRSEYIYVMNADTYQKTGKIELKRVLKAEVSSLNILSPTYYRECEERTPNPGEDPKVSYDLNPALINSQGYKGPTQMNDASVTAFMKYLLANPKTRAYVVNFFQTADKSSVHVAAAKLEKLFFATNGSPLPIKDCAYIHTTKIYGNLKIKGSVTDAYKKLVKTMPKKLFLSELEKYQLGFFGIGRSGKPQEIIEEVAKNMNIKTTRVPLCIMGAAYCHVNWRGNGRKALTDAKRTNKLNASAIAKSWVSDKGINGVIALSELNIITPEIINQFLQMGISGADELSLAYNQAIQNQDKKIKITQQKENTSKKTAYNKTLNLLAYFTKQHS